MKIEWSPAARATARRYLADQEGLFSVGMAVSRLAGDPSPAEAHPWGCSTGLFRLHVGPYRVMYRRRGDMITIGRVDRVTDL